MMGCFGGSSSSKSKAKAAEASKQRQSSSAKESPQAAGQSASATTNPNPIAEGPASASHATVAGPNPTVGGLAPQGAASSSKPSSSPHSNSTPSAAAGLQAPLANGEPYSNGTAYSPAAGGAASGGGAGAVTVNANEILRLNLGEIKLVLQKLAGVNGNPMIALNEASELLCKHLSVSFCSIVGFTDHCSTSILLAAYGNGSSEVESTPVMRGGAWSCAHLLEQPLCLHYSVQSEEQVAQLPTDFQTLCRAGNLHSFLAVPIATDHEVLGALTIAKEDPEGFEVDWWEPMLSCLSMGLLTTLRNEQIQHLCQLMKVLEYAPDYIMLIHHLLRGAFTLLLRATNIKTGCRLALISNEVDKALVFEPDHKQPGVEDVQRMAPQNAQDAEINVTEIPLDNTLLLDAVQKGKARFVSDCASYIQSCMKPATDIFISGHEMVASIVVLPLIYKGQTFGGFYVTLETSSNFQNIKDLLMGFVNSVVLVLHKRLQPERDTIWETILNRPITQQDGTPITGMEPGARQPGDSQASAADSTAPGAKPVIVKRSCTEAMLKVLQNELRKTHAKSQALEWIEELSLFEIVGKGGFGVVYKGAWKGSIAAVKVMYARQHERQAMKDALEMAVLTTVSHPNIVQVYNCFTDMIEDASGTNAPMTEGKINVRFRRLQPDEDRSLATCNILVMEFCDRASLRHAMKKGVFHKRLGNTSVAVDLCAIVQVLIEVAQAIQHLHAMKLIHCDIKPENVLLKSDPSKALSFVSKLSDFGLAKLLRENYYIVNRSGSGTVTHLAPELFQVGSKLTTAVDSFSFGIMMWELYTGQRAYGGLGRDAIIDRVYKKKARPIFPLGVPPAYAALAKQCWDDEPPNRPTFPTVLSRLSEMLTAFQNANSAAAASAVGGAPGGVPPAPPPS